MFIYYFKAGIELDENEQEYWAEMAPKKNDMTPWLLGGKGFRETIAGSDVSHLYLFIYAFSLFLA